VTGTPGAQPGSRARTARTWRASKLGHPGPGSTMALFEKLDIGLGVYRGEQAAHLVIGEHVRGLVADTGLGCRGRGPGIQPAARAYSASWRSVSSLRRMVETRR